MRFFSRYRSVYLFLFCLASFTGCAPKYTGPWNMAELNKVPAAQWGQWQMVAGKTVREVYYTNEPYQGHETRVFAYYACPVEKRKVPAIVLVHGGGGKAFPEWARMWADRGYAAIAMDLAGHGPDGKRLPDGGPEQTDDVKIKDISKGMRAAWPYHAVAAVIRAHSLLRSLPEVDASRIGITGISWGGYLTCIVAGLDNRFKVAVPVYGCGYLYENSVWLDQFNKMPPTDRQLWIENYDPSRYLPGAHMPILFVNGTNDFAYPLDSYQKSYRAAHGPRTVAVIVRRPHGHPEGWAPKEIGMFVDSVLTGGQPLARFGRVVHDGSHVSVDVKAGVPLTSAALNYTSDVGRWQGRNWVSVPARLDAKAGRISADLPAGDNLVWFLTATDERGATVSTEHETRVKAEPNTRPG